MKTGTVVGITLAVFLVLAAQGWATRSLGSDAAIDEGAAVAAQFFLVTVLGGALVVAFVWRDWFHNYFTRLPKRRASRSMSRHLRNRDALARGFRTWVRSPAGSLPEPPGSVGHDDEFLMAWANGDLYGCERRLDMLAGEVDRRRDAELGRLVHYQRCLERSRETVSGMARLDHRTSSVLDEDD